MHTDLKLLLDPLTLRAKAKVVHSANLLASTPRPSDPGDLIYTAQALAPCAGKRGGDTYTQHQLLTLINILISKC